MIRLNWYRKSQFSNKTNIGILIADDFEDSELLKPKKYFESQNKYNVMIIGDKVLKTYVGKNGSEVESDAAIQSINKNELDILIIPGGKAPEKLKENEDMIDLVRQMNDNNKLIAAICHGPLVLIEAGITSGKNITGYKEIQNEIKESGANFKNEAVVIDDNIITSRKPEDIPKFIEAIEENS